MLYNLLYPLSEYYSVFNVFRYITFRAAYAMVTSLVIMLVFGNITTQFLRKWKLSQQVKGFEPARHKVKEGTPTMGGVMIVVASVVSTVLWCDMNNKYVWIVLFIYVSFACIGFADDYIKTIKNNPMGLRSRIKFLWQVVVAGIGVLLLWFNSPGNFTYIMLPFFKELTLDLGWLYPVLACFIIVGTSNAVNLTDGLDGLAIMPSVVAFGSFAVLCYIAGNAIYTNYLAILNVKGASEVAIFCSAMAGAGFGFLWFNAYPATVFMGDVGSLSIGGALGAVAIVAKQEILLVIIGGLFVVETLSVVFQVGYFKMTKGKRLFMMAPLHHHFELKGWSEPKIIVRFWIISLLLAIIAMSTLKLR